MVEFEDFLEKYNFPAHKMCLIDIDAQYNT